MPSACVQQADAIGRNDVGLERGDRLAIKHLAPDAELGERCLLGLGGGEPVAAPGLEPAGLADAMAGAGLHDPVAMQLQRGPDQAVQRGGARFGLRRRCRREEAHHPAGIGERPRNVPAQRRMRVGQIFRQVLQQRRRIERQDRARGDDAGIAVGGFAAGLAAIDDDDGEPALLRGEGRRDADHTGTEHRNIDLLCWFALAHGVTSRSGRHRPAASRQ